MSIPINDVERVAICLHSATRATEPEVSRIKGGLLLRSRKPKLALDELLAKITPQNIHGETGWGAAAGREIW